MQATIVVPLPIQLSKIKSPSFVYVLIKYSSSANGFCVLCKQLLCLSLGNTNTLRGYLSVSPPPDISRFILP